MKNFLQTYWPYLIPVILVVVIVVYYERFSFDFLPTVFSGALSIILFAMCSFEWFPWLHRNIHRRVALFLVAFLLVIYSMGQGFNTMAYVQIEDLSTVKSDVRLLKNKIEHMEKMFYLIMGVAGVFCLFIFRVVLDIYRRL